MFRDRDGYEGHAPKFVRIAVTPEQIEELSLAEAPAKKTDVRGNWVGGTVQAEAIDPRTLADIMRGAIEGHLDMRQLARDRAHEKDIRESLAEQLKGLDL